MAKKKKNINWIQKIKTFFPNKSKKQKHSRDKVKVKIVDKKYSIAISDFNFYYNFGKKQALFNINLNIKRNKIMALIGPSGCGKSTLLRSINRMNDLIEGTKITGEIIYQQQNIYDNKQDIIALRTTIGMVFQKPNPFPKSIYDNVAYGPRSLGIRNRKKLDEIIEDSLKKAALWDEVKNDLKSPALSLSGGQQQRLCIARAIAIKPEVLLMDEPTSALDPIATGKIEELILQLKKDFTIIIVTHSMQQAARISDQTAFFLMGKIVEVARTRKLFLSPQQKETEDYIAGRFG